MRTLLDESIALLKSDKVKRVVESSQHALNKTGKKYKVIDFSMPIRPFVKKYSKEMSGPKKFTLLLAFLSKGEVSKQIELKEIKKCWNKMTSKSLLGMKFNLFYSGNAKENDWVNTEKSGSYHLRPSWKEIFNEKH